MDKERRDPKMREHASDNGSKTEPVRTKVGHDLALFQIAVTWDFLGLFLSLHVGQASLVKNPPAVQEIWV